MHHHTIRRVPSVVATLLLTVVSFSAHAQVQLPPQAPDFGPPPGQGFQGSQQEYQPAPYPPGYGAQPGPGYPGASPPPGAHSPPQQQGAGLAYSFRPDLTNAQYGRCLGLEKHWKALWHQYNDGYHNAMQMFPGDPRWAQVTHYMANLKQQLDAAWHQFSSECIYFREPKR